MTWRTYQVVTPKPHRGKSKNLRSKPTILCLHHHSYSGTLRERICESQHVIRQISGQDPRKRPTQKRSIPLYVYIYMYTWSGWAWVHTSHELMWVQHALTTWLQKNGLSLCRIGCCKGTHWSLWSHASQLLLECQWKGSESKKGNCCSCPHHHWQQGLFWNNSLPTTPWKINMINMEPTNHPFRKENDLPHLHDYVPC